MIFIARVRRLSRWKISTGSWTECKIKIECSKFLRFKKNSGVVDNKLTSKRNAGDYGWKYTLIPWHVRQRARPVLIYSETRVHHVHARETPPQITQDPLMILSARSLHAGQSSLHDRKAEQKRMLISYSLRQRLRFFAHCCQLSPSRTRLIFRDLWRCCRFQTLERTIGTYLQIPKTYSRRTNTYNRNSTK